MIKYTDLCLGGDFLDYSVLLAGRSALVHIFICLVINTALAMVPCRNSIVVSLKK